MNEVYFFDDQAWSDAYNAGKQAALPDVDELAQIIRFLDGKHSLGAGALAEAILAELREPKRPLDRGAYPARIIAKGSTE